MKKIITVIISTILLALFVGCSKQDAVLDETITYEVMCEIHSLNVQINAADFKIVSADEFLVESFLYDTDICDPFTLPDMEKACERIKSAIDEGEKITIFGDYDADGVTSTALLYSYLSGAGANVDYYIPDRAGEGYGMNVPAIATLKERGTKLIITVDNGISAIEEIEYTM